MVTVSLPANSASNMYSVRQVRRICLCLMFFVQSDIKGDLAGYGQSPFKEENYLQLRSYSRLEMGS